MGARAWWKSKRGPSSARQVRPRLCPFLRQGKRDDNEKRSETQNQMRMTQRKLAATGGAGGFGLRRSGPRNIGVGEILRCAQNDDTTSTAKTKTAGQDVGAFLGFAASLSSSCMVLWSNFRAAAATFSSRCETREVPGIGSMTGERQSSQVKASCDGVVFS